MRCMQAVLILGVEIQEACVGKGAILLSVDVAVPILLGQKRERVSVSDQVNLDQRDARERPGNPAKQVQDHTVIAIAISVYIGY